MGDGGGWGGKMMQGAGAEGARRRCRSVGADLVEVPLWVRLGA